MAKESRPSGMMANSPLEFDSDFEGGNLDAAYWDNNEFKLIIRPDSNTRGHCHYFHFK